jgi:hypothetical protein
MSDALQTDANSLVADNRAMASHMAKMADQVKALKV